MAGDASTTDETAATAPRWVQPLRSRVVRLPAGLLLWKILVAIVGAAVVGVGILLIPLPGPGWAIVFLGLAVWATEFEWAKRLLVFGRTMLRRWLNWVMRQSLFVRALIGAAGLLLIAAIFYLGWLLFLS